MKLLLNRTIRPIIKPIIVSIIVLTVVFAPLAETLAGPRYRSVRVLPKSDLAEQAVGFGITVTLPFITYGIGEALGAFGQAASQTANATGSGAANVGASVANVGTKVGSTGASLANVGASIGNTGAQMANAGSKLATIGSLLLNPSGLSGMQAIVGNMAIYHAAATAGQTLTKVGAYAMGMDPAAAQFMGMVGSSATMFGMAGIGNSAGISAIYPSSKFAANYPITTGILTGAGFGAVTGGISIGVQEGLKGSVPPGTAAAIGNLVGTTLGAGLWGGLTVGLTGAVAEGAKTSFVEGFKYGLYGGTTEGLREFGKQLALQAVDIGITWGAEEAGLKPAVAGVLGSTGAMLVGNVSYAVAGGLGSDFDFQRAQKWGLKRPAQITNDPRVDAFLEPLIYGGPAVGLAYLTQDMQPYQAALANMGAFLVSATISSGIQSLTTNLGPQTEFGRQIGGSSGVFWETWGRKVFDYSAQTIGFGTEVGYARLSEPTTPYLGAIGATTYGGAEQLSKLWSFAGIGDFTIRAHQVRKQGGDWRTVDLVGSPFSSWTGRASSLARFHTLRNIEASAYDLIREVAPPDPRKHPSSYIRREFAKMSPKDQRYTLWALKGSMEPPVYRSIRQKVTLEDGTEELIKKFQIKTFEHDITIAKDDYAMFHKLMGWRKTEPIQTTPAATQPTRYPTTQPKTHH